VTVTFLILLMFFGAACTPAQTKLAEFTENDVNVSIQLEKTEAGGYLLSATFTPPEGFHLYSKDIPRGGVDGLGRPTLLELPAGAKMQASGELAENIAAEIPAFEPKELLIYPEGAVTLSLPVTLPTNGTSPIEDVVSVTFMACRPTGCRLPVVGKILYIRISPNK
jgi:hypothetical protein